MSRYLNSLAVKNKAPLSGHFELTQNCNFSCPMCYVHECKKKAELSAETWISFGEQAKRAGTLFLLLTGGEPLLREDFEEIYTALSKMGFLISVNTNGSLAKNYMTLFKKYPPFRVNVSLYAAQREAYKNFCSADKFDDVVGAIELFKNNKISVRLNSVFTKENYSQAPEIIRFAKEHDLYLKSTAYTYPQVRLKAPCGKNRVALSPRAAAECETMADIAKLGDILYAAKAKRILLEDEDISDSESFRKVHCRAGRSSFWLTWNGKMRACAMLPEPETEPLRVGFESAWRELSEKMQLIRLPKECSVCKRRKSCPVCAAMCFCETGEFSKKPEYVCEFFENLCRLSAEKMSDGALAVPSEEIKSDFEEDIYDC